MSDSYLNNKVWNQNSLASESATKSQYYEKIMDVFDEPSDYSINVVVNDFFKSFQQIITEQFLLMEYGELEKHIMFYSS